MPHDFEMAMAVFLKDDTPPEILAAFQYMLRDGRDEAAQVPPTNPFTEADFPTGFYEEIFKMLWFRPYEPAQDYPAALDNGWRLHNNSPEEFLYGGGYTVFPGEYGAALRKVYVHHRSEKDGGDPVYKWMLSFRVAADIDMLSAYWDFAGIVARYSSTERIRESQNFVGYVRFLHDKTPTLFYCLDEKLFSYEVPWVPENLVPL